MSRIETLTKQAFAPDGYLAKRGFNYNPVQYEYAVGIAKNLNHKGKFNFYEASTGVGKSIGYLIPSLLYSAITSNRTIIATHTIQLQKQLIEKDLIVAQEYLDSISLSRPIVEQRIGMMHFVDPERVARLLKTNSIADDEMHFAFLKWAVDCAMHGDGLIENWILNYGELPGGINASQICITPLSSELINSAYSKLRVDCNLADVLITSHMMLLSNVGNIEYEGEYPNIILDEADLLPSVANSITDKHVRLDYIEKTLHNSMGVLTKKGQSIGLECVDMINEIKLLCAQEKHNPIEEYHLISSESSLVKHRALLNKLLDTLSSVYKFIQKSKIDTLASITLDDLSYVAGETKNSLGYFSDVLGIHYTKSLRTPAYLIYQSLPASKIKWFTKQSGVITCTSATLSDTMTNNKLSFKNFSNQLGLTPRDINDQKSYEPKNFGEISFELAGDDIERPFLKGCDKLNHKWLSFVLRFLKQSVTNNKTLVLTSSYKETISLKDMGLSKATFHTSGPLSEAIAQHLKDGTQFLISPVAFSGVSIRTNAGGQHFTKLVITRIPFQPISDIERIKKERYYRSINIANPKAKAQRSALFDGTQQSISKLKQGVGRLIRHKSDLGTVAILDPRMKKYTTQQYAFLLNSIPSRFKENFINHKIIDSNLNLLEASDLHQKISELEGII